MKEANPNTFLFTTHHGSKNDRADISTVSIFLVSWILRSQFTKLNMLLDLCKLSWRGHLFLCFSQKYTSTRIKHFLTYGIKKSQTG